MELPTRMIPPSIYNPYPNSGRICPPLYNVILHAYRTAYLDIFSPCQAGIRATRVRGALAQDFARLGRN